MHFFISCWYANHYLANCLMAGNNTETTKSLTKLYYTIQVGSQVSPWLHRDLRENLEASCFFKVIRLTKPLLNSL